jgi:uncharacterized protein YajQ (UPF0234 family)
MSKIGIEEGKKQQTFSVGMIGGLISATLMLLGSIFTVFNWMITSELNPIHTRLDAIELTDKEIIEKHDNVLLDYSTKLKWINETIIIKSRNDLSRIEVLVDILENKVNKVENEFRSISVYKERVNAMDKEMKEIKELLRKK